jgi:hypothetical protein
LAVRHLAVLATVVGALLAPALAHAAAPPIARPNPAVYPVRLDYETPLLGSNGSAATLAPLGHGVIVASTRDRAYLAYERRDDLGGFVAAPIGQFALSSGGRDLLLPGQRAAQIPLFSQAAGGAIASFTFTGPIPNPPVPPDNGKQPVPRIGPPPPVPPPGGNPGSPANQGFGGRPGGSGGGGGTTKTGGGTTTTTGGRPGTTTTGTTTTATTTQATTATTVETTTAGGGSGSGGGGASGRSGCTGGSCAAGSCGVPGIQVDSTAPGCIIGVSGALPGDSISETFTITNTTGAPFVLSVGAEALPSNHLSGDLQMGVWDASGPPPGVLPPLTSWLAGFIPLTTLNAGQSVQYVVELYLPTTAGNADQGKIVSVSFRWQAQG